MKSFVRSISLIVAVVVSTILLPRCATAANNWQTSMALKFAGDQNYGRSYINEATNTGYPMQGCGILGTTNWNNVVYGSSPYIINGLVYDVNGIIKGNASTSVLVDFHSGEQGVYTGASGWSTNLLIYNNLLLLDTAEKYPAGGQVACQLTNLDPVFATNGFSVFIYYLGSAKQGQQFYVTTFNGPTTNNTQLGTQECSLYTTTNWNSFGTGGSYLTNPPAYMLNNGILTQGIQYTASSTNGETWGADYIVFSNLTGGALAICVSNTSYGAMSGFEIVANYAPGVIGPIAVPTTNVTAGAAVNIFCLTNGGAGPYTCQWQGGANGTTFTNVTGATTTNLMFSSIATANAGYYQMVYGMGGTQFATSSVVHLTVYAAPTISATTASPSSTVNQGTAVTFTATPSGGAPNPTYQWQASLNGTTYTNVSGATSASYVLSSATLAGSGNYYDCIYTAGGISVTSAPVQLTVQPLSISPAIALPSSAIYSGGSAVMVCSNFAGLGAFNFQWQMSSTLGGTYVNVPGATTNYLAIAGATAANSGYYQCVFTAANGSIISTPVQLGVLTAGGPAASLAIKFASTFDYGNCAITNLSKGTGLLNTTNWNNTDLGNNSGLLLPFYDVHGVTNTSQAGLFEYTHSSDDFITDQNQWFNATNNNKALLNTSHIYGGGVPMFLVTNLDPVFINGFNVIYYFAGDTTVGAGGQFTISSYSGPMTNSPYAQLTQSLNWSLYGTNVLTNALGIDWTAQHVFVQGAYAAQTSPGAWETNYANYLIYSNFSGASVFFYTPSGSYQGLAGCEIVANYTGSGRASTTSTLTSSTNFAALGTLVTFTNTVSPAPANGDYVVFMDGPTVIGYGNIVSGGYATLTTSNLVAGNHNITASYGGNVTTLLPSTSGIFTYIVAGGSQTISAATVLPAAAVMTGTSATLVCSNYSGTPVYGFQWQQSGDGITYTNVGTATTNLLGNMLTIASLVPGNSGYYQLIFTANGNSITSSAVHLTVYPTATIGAATASPSATVNQGGSVLLNAATNGGAPSFSIQWQVSANGTTYNNIAGATGVPYTLSGITLASSGYYYDCIYTAGGISVTSAPVQLTVNPLSGGSIIALPSSSFYPGMTVEMICTNYTGLGSSYAFQWQMTNAAAGGFTNIVGQTRNWMVLVGAQAANAGFYQCVVSPSNGSVTSAPFLLNALTPGGPVPKISIKMNADKDYSFCAITNPTGAGALNSTNWFNLYSAGGGTELTNLTSYYTGGKTNPSTAVLYESHTPFFGVSDIIDNSGIPINSTNNNMALLNSSYSYSSSQLCCSITNLDPVFVSGYNVYVYYEGVNGTNAYGGQYIVTSYSGQTTNGPVATSEMWSLFTSNPPAFFTTAINWGLGAGVFVRGAYSSTQTSWGSWENPGANYIVFSNLTGGAFNLAVTNGASYPGVAAIEIVANNTGTALTATTSAVTDTTNYAPYGTVITFTNTVSPAPPNGENVVFLDGSTVLGLGALNGGVATFTASSTLALGNHTISAVYGGDDNYLASTNSMVQNVNSPPTATPMTVTITAGLNLEIPISTLATNWQDADGDAVSLVSVQTSTNGVTVTTNGGFILYSNPNAVNDQFSYVITDIHGAHATGVVNIVATVSAPTTLNITAQNYNVNGSISLSFAGIPGDTYVLQGSTNLPNWVPLYTNVVGSNGLWQFTDTQATNFPVHYYRTVSQ